MSKLIGIGGLFSSGKDTVADYLVEKYGWVKMGMSDPLNDALLTLNPLIDCQFEGAAELNWETDQRFVRYEIVENALGYTNSKLIPEVRRLLQVLGTEVGRNMMGENTWIDIAERRINNIHRNGQSVILTGLRFPNETRMIRQNRGHLWWVNRPELNNTGQTATHSSENSVDASNFDHIIENSGSLEELYEKVDKILVGP